MKILHTSDWHLGCTLHGRLLIDDQRDALAQIRAELQQGYSAILIAGDVYDRAIPPPEAIALLSEFLEDMSRQGIAVVLIPGNHDSPSRMAFADGILESSGIHFRCDYRRLNEPVTLQDSSGAELDVFALPFVETPLVRESLANEAIADHQEATAAALCEIRKGQRSGIPSVLMAHAYVGKDSQRTESERELFVGGSGIVSPDTFDGFDYTALGHLHRPQALGGQPVRYAGSIFAYSFSEVDHTKQAVCIEVAGSGALRISPVNLKPKHTLTVIEDSFEAILDGAKYDACIDHYVSVRLTDDKFLLNTYARLKERLPFLLELRQAALEASSGAHVQDRRRPETDSPSNVFDLFLDYFGWNDAAVRSRAKRLLEGALTAAGSRGREVHQ